jgi:fructose/tagatose bisphosphate aldolase
MVSHCTAHTCSTFRKSLLEENIEICAKYFESMAKLGMTLEIELGVTGGEEDGVDNSDVDSSKLYTQPEEVALCLRRVVENLSKLHHCSCIR